MHIASREIDLDALVTAGQRQGYLTYAEINDFLPRGVTDIDAMEDVLRLLDKAGVTVREREPDAEALLAVAESERKPVQGAKRGAGGLSLEEDPDASTDPVAHYFRDMGAIQRLEPGDEVSLAKRIEQNVRQITQALALCPAAVSALLEAIDSADVTRVFVDPDDDLSARLAIVREAHQASLNLIDSNGSAHPDLDSLRHTLVSELGELRLTRSVHDALVARVRGLIERIRDAESRITTIIVDRARVPRRQFLESFPGFETSDTLVDRLMRLDGNHEVTRALADDIRSAQADIRAAVDEAGLTVGGLKTLGRSISTAHAAANRAREAMVEANLRLVVSIAKGFNKRGVQFSDLVQEGNIGLMQAVDHFDWRKPGGFARQASWWIRKAINQSLGDQAHAIHVPASTAGKIHRLNTVQRRMAHDMGRDPSTAQLAAALKLPEDEVAEIQRLAREPLSLETPIGEDEGPFLGDYIADDNARSAGRTADVNAMREAARDLLKELNPTEAAALKLHFGIGTDRTMSYEELSKQLDMSRDHIRRIGVRALRKLRDPEKAAAFRALLLAVEDS